MKELVMKDLHVSTKDKEILKGITLTVKEGETVALMGPNGSGKSTLAYALMGHPEYTITQGKIFLSGEDITTLPPEERARKGLFLSYQQPVEIPGVRVSDFLMETRRSLTGEKISLIAFKRLLREQMKRLGIEPSFAYRYLNQGFSGGEKKRMEILQLVLSTPSIAILDETDSGLDIDALRTITTTIKKLQEEQGTGLLVITHYQRLLHYLQPDKVIILIDGKIVKQGGPGLVDKLEAEGYSWAREEQAAEE